MESTASLQESIESYKDQLNKIQTLLAGSVGDETIRELKSIEQDLLQILNISQEQLLEIRKQEVLGEVESKYGEGTSQSNEIESDGAESIDDLLDALVGIQCRAPYEVPHAYGRSMSIAYHSAVVSEVVLDDFMESHQITDLKVQIFFSHPLVLAMKPCQYYLDDNCNYVGDKCRFSHGSLVKFSDLLEFVYPNFDELTENSSVLVKNLDDLWNQATIVAICREEKRAVVRFLETCQESTVTFDELFPLAVENGGIAAQEPDSAGDSSDCSLDNDDVSPTTPNPHSSSAPSTSSGGYTLATPFHSKPEAPLGNWESHTKGVGSRLMAKMGYVFGDGLGKTNQGIVNPVKAVVLPKGKSLDNCATELKNDGKDPLHTVKRQKHFEKLKNQKVVSGCKRPAKKDIFDFLNKRLKSDASKDETNREKTKIDKKSPQAARYINIELLKIDGNRRTIRSEMKRLNEAILRNKGKDAVMLRQLEAKLSGAEDNLAALNKREIKLNREKESHNDKKKLSIF